MNPPNIKHKRRFYKKKDKKILLLSIEIGVGIVLLPKVQVQLVRVSAYHTIKGLLL